MYAPRGRHPAVRRRLGLILHIAMEFRSISHATHGRSSYRPSLCRAFPCPPIMSLTDMFSRCRPLAAHGAMSCLSVRTQPPTATGAPSTDLYHTIIHARVKSWWATTNDILFGDDTLGQGSFGTWYALPSTSMVDSVTGLRYAECSRAPDYINIGFLGRCGTYACPQCLPSDTVPIRSWTRTLRPPGIRHRHLPCHAIPHYAPASFIYTTAWAFTRVDTGV